MDPAVTPFRGDGLRHRGGSNLGGIREALEGCRREVPGLRHYLVEREKQLFALRLLASNWRPDLARILDHRLNRLWE